MHNNFDCESNQISVVCPTFNCEDYILKTIKSIIDQSTPPDEVVFSDDGSTDNTIEIIKSSQELFFAKKIKLKILASKHSGPGHARNKGIDASSKDWIAFLDADDLWKKNKIEIIRDEINKESKANCFLHWEVYRKLNGTNHDLLHGKDYYNPSKPLLPQLYNRNFFSTSAIVCKKKVIKNFSGFDTKLPNAQDYDLWLKMAEELKLVIIPIILGYYVERSTNITSRPYYKKINSELLIAHRYRKKVNLKNYLIKLIRIILSKQWLYSFLRRFQ